MPHHPGSGALLLSLSRPFTSCAACRLNKMYNLNALSGTWARHVETICSARGLVYPRARGYNSGRFATRDGGRETVYRVVQAVTRDGARHDGQCQRRHSLSLSPGSRVGWFWFALCSHAYINVRYVMCLLSMLYSLLAGGGYVDRVDVCMFSEHVCMQFRYTLFACNVEARGVFHASSRVVTVVGVTLTFRGGAGSASSHVNRTSMYYIYAYIYALSGRACVRMSLRCLRRHAWV